MQNDDITWGIINRTHCSYKIKTQTQHFCRNEFNVSGLCNRKSCPLANSQYATVRESRGKVFLYIRFAEKVYTPIDQWKKIKLPKNFIDAQQVIEDNLVFWPQFFKRKCRQRHLKITQYLSRMRNMKLHDNKVLVPVRQKDERRLKRREEKALIAAKLDTAIEEQLLNRLKQGTYERIYNFPKKAFDLRLEKEIQEEEERDEMLEDEEEVEQEECVTVAVKEDIEEEEDEEEIEQELEAELEKGLVRMRRQEDSDDEMYDSDEAEFTDEEEMEQESEEEEADGHVEYIADFEESDEEEQDDDVPDIEEAAERLQPALADIAGPSKPRAAPRRPKVSGDVDSDDEAEQDKFRSKKYVQQKPGRRVKKVTASKRKIREIYEKQKAAKVTKKSVKITRS